MTSDISKLRKFVAPEVIFGEGAIELAGQYAVKHGGLRVLVVTDPGVMNAGWTSKVLESIEAAGISYKVFSGVSPNPRDAEVMKGFEVYESGECDSIIAIGGGSPIDCAKGIGIVATNSGHILDFEGVDKIIAPMPPLICIPTTSGSSADVSQFAIINNVKCRTKIAIISKAIVPDVALIDPNTLTTMSPYLTACTGVDALVHAIEAYVSNAHSPMTDLHALEAIRLVGSGLPALLDNPGDETLRRKVMLGSMQAGLAFSNASLGAVHAMSHSLGGFKDLAHGECNAMLLPHVIDFNFETSPERYAAVGAALGLELGGTSTKETHKRILEKITGLLQKGGIVETLAAKGVHRNDVATLAEKAINDACIVTNPRPANRRDLEVIYEHAL